MVQFPEFGAACVAAGCKEPDLAEHVVNLPFMIQVELMGAVFSLTFPDRCDLPGDREIWENVVKAVSGITGDSWTLADETSLNGGAYFSSLTFEISA